MLGSGVYVAAVTPMDEGGRVDDASVARLLAYFEAAGCKGVVLAGTNGEGPSLSAIEKRDLLRTASKCAGALKLVLGIATPSLDEARWTCEQAAKNGAVAALVMPPAYYREATADGVLDWFVALADESPCPIIAYNFPKMTGFTMTEEFVSQLAQHDNVIGFKDSSGEMDNLITYRRAATEGTELFVGNETLLLQALKGGWTGTISGAANCIPQWLAKVVAERDEPTFRTVRAVVEAIRSCPQPMTNKAVLHALGVISTPTPRLPLVAGDPARALDAMREHFGITAGNLAL
ncbi:MAG: dihydrodipicolinate synthase family protein [Armatimonadetes bacterium]|nr:dihydrodipicolinate synthase family protein [Armatimonadota bacterium]